MILRRTLALATSLFAAALLAAPSAGAALTGEPQTVAQGLEVPWEVVLVPDGRTWVTERDCRVRSIATDGALRTIFTDPSPGITCRKFLGLEPHPDFASNRFVYLYETVTENSVNRSRILRLVDDGTNLVSPKVVFDGGIGSDLNHDGGRMKFGPDRKLYVTTGDIHNPALPQDRQSLNGKILRLEAPGTDADGTAPADNPFVGEGGRAVFVWSYGHRHPQGIAWDANGRMWESEHGPSGESYSDGECCRDEINIIDRGANYGWPVIRGDTQREGMRTPVVHAGTTKAWAPGGLAFGTDGKLYAPMLRDVHLRQFTLSCTGVSAQAEFFRNSPGRLRSATVGRGALYFTTDFRNGATDKVLKVDMDPEGFRPLTCAAAESPPAETASPAQDAPAPSAAQQSAPGTTVTRLGPGAALSRLLARTRAALLRPAQRSRGTLSAAAGGFAPGTLTLALRRGSGRGIVTLARGTRSVRDRRVVSVRMRFSRAGRRVLNGSAGARRSYRLTASFISSAGARTTRTTRVTLPRPARR